MDGEGAPRTYALSPRVLLFDIVQQSSNAPEQQVQEAQSAEEPEVRGSPRGSRRRLSPPRTVSPLSEDDVAVENLKKRKKRSSTKLQSPTQTQKSEVQKPNDEDDDDGILCPICYEEWDMSGIHRLTSLKCGHLFGHSCIKRWLSESPPGARVCPSCKSKATLRDMRFLYAKRLRMVDNSEKERIQTLLEEALVDKSRAQTELSMLRHRYEQQISENARLSRELCELRASGNVPAISDASAEAPRKQYRIFLEKNVELSREAGCRVIQFARKGRSLVVSQKSNQGLFPGYGVRFMDLSTLKPTTFMHMTARSIRDVAFDCEGVLLVAASVDQGVKVYDVTSRQCAVTLKCPEEDSSVSKVIWSCCFDRTREQSVIVGCQNGRVSRFDMRNPTTPQDFRAQPVDLSPVINIVSIVPDNTMPCGAVLVCTLQNLWLYELGADGMPSDITALPLEGPFTAMVYDDATRRVLVTVRPSQATNRPTSQYIVGRFDRINESVAFIVSHTFAGSNTMPVMFRSALLGLEQDTLVAAYVHSRKALTTFSTRDNCRLQTISAAEPIMDLCPFLHDSQIYLGALTDTKCRFYKVE
ncbi:E3 ubiquitin-protein ligase RFWD3 [Phlebotomus argentipes]|uniref:E3 ubiquitin-protein ligase RFWD3 n=1 Tax=Phlebotomus argentipes TaxID=94469 RepID=UPI002892AD88|nr:E3 ubiquitin-protein ligase RFWD3 [Phlebotomus argentipes]